MSDVNDILALSQKLQNLQNRVAQLDAERKSVQEEIAVCLSDLGLATKGHIFPGDNASTRELVLWVMNKYPERPISPKDICIEAGIAPSTIRTLLQRMEHEGILRRTSHGRYELAAP